MAICDFSNEQLIPFFVFVNNAFAPKLLYLILAVQFNGNSLTS